MREPIEPPKKISECVEFTEKELHSNTNLSCILQQLGLAYWDNDNGFTLKEDIEWNHIDIQAKLSTYYEFDSDDLYLEVSYGRWHEIDNPNYEQKYQQYLEDKQAWDDYVQNIKKKGYEEKIIELAQKRKNLLKEAEEIKNKIDNEVLKWKTT